MNHCVLKTDAEAVVIPRQQAAALKEILGALSQVRQNWENNPTMVRALDRAMINLIAEVVAKSPTLAEYPASRLQ